MSFRSFILYCAVCGGWAAFLSWAVGRAAVGEHPAVGVQARIAGVQGLFLGMFVALALSLVDALWNSSARQVGRAIPRVLAGLVIGAVGGLIGGFIGQKIADPFQAAFLSALFVIIGWIVTGLLVGASIGAFDMIQRFVYDHDLRGAVQKIIKGALGGTVGGLLGGVLSLVLRGILGRILKDMPTEEMMSPSATGFVVLGLCIGLMIGLAQVIFREAWLKVEAGFRAGRELILTKPEITIGRAESCDVGLFGDSGVDRLHARIIQQGNQYVLVDAGSNGGTFVNDEPIDEPTPLRSGDQIRLGNSVLSFQERQKRAE